MIFNFSIILMALLSHLECLSSFSNRFRQQSNNLFQHRFRRQSILPNGKMVSYNTHHFSSSSSSSLSSLSLSSSNKKSWVQKCLTTEDIENLGRKLSYLTDIGDLILLSGDLGAGKTTFSRGFIREKFNDDDMLVTSPSYLLDNSYLYIEDDEGDDDDDDDDKNNDFDKMVINNNPPNSNSNNDNNDNDNNNNNNNYDNNNKYRNNNFKTIHHMDLYRLPNGCDLSILGIPTIFATSLCIIEWPERINKNDLPEHFLNIVMKINNCAHSSSSSSNSNSNSNSNSSNININSNSNSNKNNEGEGEGEGEDEGEGEGEGENKEIRTIIMTPSSKYWEDKLSLAFSK